MQVRCPQCASPIDTDVDDSLADVACPNCGSSFSLIGTLDTVAYRTESRTIGHFKLVEQVGIGQFGTVWRANDTELDRVVAIKVPRKGSLSPKETEQFLREARAAAQLRHPNIVSVHEVGRSDESVYIVSDFVKGVTLADWLTAQSLTPREAAELCVKIADALEHAHATGVVHRDLKPGNIMMTADGEPHIMDFGLAKRDAGEVTMTTDGQVLGTPAYMSPEQARGEAHLADCRADVYSLGVVLFQLLTGELPFRGNSRMLLHQVLNDEAPSPRKLNLRVPRDLETICLKCLEKEPRRRYASAQDVADELNRFLRNEPIQARPVSAAARLWRWCRRKPVLASVSGTLFAVLLFVVIAAPAIAWRQTVLRDEAESQRKEAEKATAEAMAATKEKDAAVYETRHKVLQSWETLAQARYSQARVLWNDRTPNRQRLALEYLAEAAALAGDARRLAAGFDDDPGGWKRRTDAFWAKQLPLLRSEAARWLTQTSVQQLSELRTSVSNTGVNRFFVRRAAFALSPDGDVLAVLRHPQKRSEAPRIDLVDTLTGAPLRSVPVNLDRGATYELTFAFTPDGKRLRVLTRDRGGFLRGTPRFQMQLLNVESGTFGKQVTLKFVEGQFVSSSLQTRWSFSSDGRRLLLAHPGSTLPATVHDAVTGNQLAKIDARKGVLGLVGDGQRFMRLNSPGEVQQVAVAGGDVRKTAKLADPIPSDNGLPLPLASPGGQWLAVLRTGRYMGGSRRQVRLELIEAATGAVRATRQLHPAYTLGSSGRRFARAFSNDGQLLALVSPEFSYIFSVPDAALLFGRRHPDVEPDGKPRTTYSSRPPWLPAHVEFADNGARLLVSLRQSNQGLETKYLTQVWDVAAGAIPSRAMAHRGTVAGVAFRDDGGLLAGGRFEVLRSWSAKGEQTWSAGYGPAESPATGTFDASGRFFIRRLPDRVDVWDAGSGKLQRSFPAGSVVAYGPKNRYLAVRDGRSPDRIRVFDLGRNTWAAEFVWGFPRYGDVRFAFSNNGNYLTARDYTGGVRIGNVADGKTVVRDALDGKFRCNALSVSSEERIAVAVLVDGITPLLTAWALPAGRRIGELTGERTQDFDGPITAFSPDGKSVAFLVRERNTNQRRVHVWRFDRAKATALKSGWSGSARMQFARNDRLIVAGNRTNDSGRTESVCELWDAAGSRLASTEAVAGAGNLTAMWDAQFFVGRVGTVAVSFHGQNNRGNYRRTTIWDVQTGRTLATHSGGDCALAADGRNLLIRSIPAIVDMKTGGLRIAARGRVPAGLGVTADGQSLVTLDAANRVALVWPLDARTHKTVRPLRKLLHRLYGVDNRSLAVPIGAPEHWLLTSDGKLLTIGGQQGAPLRVWDLATGRLERDIPLNTGHSQLRSRRGLEQFVLLPGLRGERRSGIRDLLFSPDGRLLALQYEGHVRIVDLRAGRIQTMLDRAGHAGAIASVADSLDGKLAATASADGTVCLWHADNGRFAGMLSGYGAAVARALFASDDVLVTRDVSGRIVAWKLERTKPADAGTSVKGRLLWQRAARAQALASAEAAPVVVTGHENGAIVLWDANTAARQRVLRAPDASAIQALAASRDGRRIAAVDASGHLRLWDAETGRVLHRWQMRGIVQAVAIAPESGLVATAGNDVRLWKPGRPDPLLVIRRPGGLVRSVAFDRSGNVLATGGDDRTAYLLDLDQLRERLRELRLDW